MSNIIFDFSFTELLSEIVRILKLKKLRAFGIQFFLS